MYITVDSETIKEGLRSAKEEIENPSGHVKLNVKSALAHIEDEIDRGLELRDAVKEIEETIDEEKYHRALDQIRNAENRFGKMPVLCRLRSKAESFRFLAQTEN